MEGNVIKDIDAVAGCIKKIIASAHFNCKLAACAVPESSAISKIIQINDGLTEQEIEELVIIEADKYIPYPIDEINVDFNVIGPSPKNSAMLDVLIVASRSENVSNRVEVMNRAGLVAKVVDVESYAVERACQLLKADLPSGGDKKNIAIIDIGAAYTHLFVLHGMKIIFSREEEFGGKQLIDAVVDHYGMPPAEAIVAIEQGTLPEDYTNDVLHPFTELILLQVKRALQFFFSTSHHTFVDHIILAGGIAKLPNIAQLLQEHINIPTSIANPFAQMSLSKKVNRDIITNDSPMLMVACGLALRQIE
jgi:type IV pilus assembly protein PilM